MNLVKKVLFIFGGVIVGNVLLLLMLSAFGVVNSVSAILILIETGVLLYALMHRYILAPLDKLSKALLDIDFAAEIINFNMVDNLKESGFLELRTCVQRFKYLLDIITERITQRNSATYRGEHDELTGCYNITRLQKYKSGYTLATHFAVLFIDVNNLKKMNDVFGHSAGDALLRHASHVLTKYWSNLGDIYRIGGDEFMVVVSGKSESQMSNLMTRWVTTLSQLNRSSDGFICDLSYGLAVGDCGEDFDEIMKLADERMYQMKVKVKTERGEEIR